MPGETSNEVSGVVHGPSIQTRQVRGDVHIHQPPMPPLTALGDLAHRAERPGEARTRYTQAQQILSGTGSAGQPRISERLARLDQPPALNRTATSTST